jgi:DNA replication protein DnaC
MSVLEQLSASVCNEPNKNDFIKDGLLYCGKCGTRKQTIVDWAGKKHKVNCICQCENEAYERKLDRKRTEAQKAAAKRNRPTCTRETRRSLANDDGRNSALTNVVKEYCRNFKAHKEVGSGICLHGKVRSGKTFMAECIANEIIAQGQKVYLVSAPEIAMSPNFRDSIEDVEKLKTCDLLIIDDLGVERKTEYIQEMMFSIIDYRNANKLPVIVTTNEDVETKAQTNDLMEARIYGRLREMCISILVN